MTITALLALLAVYICIAIQWRQGFPTWHIALLFIAGFATGVIFPAVFMGMASRAPEGMMHTCLGTYYLSQQLGMIIGPAVGAALSQNIFGMLLKGEIREEVCYLLTYRGIVKVSIADEDGLV